MSTSTALRSGVYYHIFQRGNNRENIFVEARNYAYFLKLYQKHVFPIADTFAYCLLKNHVHFLVRIRDTYRKTRKVSKTFRVSDRCPSQQFGNLFNAYAKAFNKAYHHSGSLFRKPFGRVEVARDAHFTHLIAYIHRNPQHHGLVSDFRDWPYSSFAVLQCDEPTFLQRDEVIDWFGGVESFCRQHCEDHINLKGLQDLSGF